jgi:hypothetical protein
MILRRASALADPHRSDESMGQQAINRRQFLVRGSAGAMALGLLAQLPAAARAAGVLAAESDAALTASQGALVEGLAAAICLANGQVASAAAALGLLTPTDFASTYAASDVETRSAIAGVLAAIEAAPAAGLFSTLGADAQAEFVAGIFADLDIYEASDQDVAVLDALSASTNALVAALHPALGSGAAVPQPAVAAPRIQPFTGATNAQYIFGQTLLCALTLVSEPLPSDARLVDMPTLSASTAASLDQWLAHRATGSRPPQALVGAITADLAGPLPAEIERRAYPCVALAQALTTWLGPPAERISL